MPVKFNDEKMFAILTALGIKVFKFIDINKFFEMKIHV